jgi:hypothetical protein
MLEADKQRKLDSLLPQVLYDFVDVNADRISQYRPYRQVTFFVDIEVGLAPELYAVEILGVFNRPNIFFGYLFRHRRMKKKFAD